MHTLVWPLGWTCQECETPTEIALGVIEARKPSHHFKVRATSDRGEGYQNKQPLCSTCGGPGPTETGSPSSSTVDQPCLDPQSTCCQELGGAAQVFGCSQQLVGG